MGFAGQVEINQPSGYTDLSIGTSNKYQEDDEKVKLEYVMQAILLLFLVVCTFMGMLAWTKWRKRGRR
jgi:hypothetical protein